MAKVIWKENAAKHDYPAAESFLSLLATPDQVERILTALKSAPIEKIKAKDVIRASRLDLLDEENFHVKRDLKKIRDKVSLSPILLVRGIGLRNLNLTIADGYHRACAVYRNSEDDYIHAKIADWEI